MSVDERGTASDWAGELAHAIGRRVRQVRHERGMTTQQLADELATFGVVIRRPVLSNLENGTRDTVAVAEVFALAAALRVPPPLLLLPIGDDPLVELLPNRSVDTWQAVEWLAGQRPMPGHMADAGWRSGADLLALYAEHASLVDDYARQTKVDGGSDSATVAEMFERAARERRLIEGHLRRVRQTIRDRNAALPELPAQLAHIEPDTAAVEPSGADGVALGWRRAADRNRAGGER